MTDWPMQRLAVSPSRRGLHTGKLSNQRQGGAREVLGQRCRMSGDASGIAPLNKPVKIRPLSPTTATMTPERAKDLLPCIIAHSERKTIQSRRGPEDPWRDNPDPTFYGPDEYRIKPGPREVWMNLYPGGPARIYYASREEADKAAENDRIHCARIELPPQE